MQYTRHLLTLGVFMCMFSIQPASVFAGGAGAIMSAHRYAWSENTGWIDFGTTYGNVTVTDIALSGYAYGENIGWISLNCANTGSCATVSYGLKTTWRPPTGGGLLRKVTVVPSFTEPTALPAGREPAVKSDPAKKPTITPLQGESSLQNVFVRNLQIGDIGEDVRTLQTFLNKQGFLLASSGAGAPSKETDFFGQRTFDALVRFQEAHAAEILTPLGLAKGTGYFGKSTRQFIAEME